MAGREREGARDRGGGGRLREKDGESWGEEVFWTPGVMSRLM